MKKTAIIILLLYFAFQQQAKSQQPLNGQPLIDSLLTELPKAKEDTVKVDLFNSLGKVCINIREFDRGLGRSDELLLNILPAETAEELKNTGTTKAKDFSEVTVLFTDFKNFTTMSEKLTAQELVNEINYCYSAFDNIITKYGIEKIKTIGDSYMCAGGLPVANVTNAIDTVSAAI